MTDCGLNIELLMQDFMSPEKDRDIGLWETAPFSCCFERVSKEIFCLFNLIILVVGVVVIN